MATNMKSRKDYISKRKRYLGESQELGKDSGTKIFNNLLTEYFGMRVGD